MILKPPPNTSSNPWRFPNKISQGKRQAASVEKTCTLAEELVHHFTTHRNIIDQTKLKNRKQIART
ncbi:hypothetical protein ABE33_11190 [Bacillus safensis]|nr:hypothetical protein [Bacillus safensis]MBG9835535.1 hypothetical protein [Bacillus safensis]MBG9861584.1 hypothetical protein [Bacillus safensis]MBG9900475.1 hypothetical protein [Bacillus safensis]PGC66255.1 hypothetical protein COL97_03080 [Bacillus safensis]